MDSEDAIKREFQDRDLDWLSAIERLQGLGYDSHAAESKVGEWFDEAIGVQT